MQYRIEFKPRALKDLADLPHDQRRLTIARIEALQSGLAGDVKRLTNYSPEYRLRAGDYRVLFDVEADLITIYRVLHRREAYR